jgi:hypothetical protein
MLPLILFGTIIGAPVLLALLFRVNAVFVFMSICAGYLLQMSMGASVDLTVAMFVKGSNTLVIARLILLALPIVLTMFFLRKTIGRSLVFQIVPLIFSGMLLGALVLPLLPDTFTQNVYSSQYGSSIRSSSDLVTAVAVATNIILAFMLFKNNSGHKKHR